MSELVMDMEELLQNTSANDIPDLPDLVTPPAGLYNVVGVSAKTGETSNGNPKIGITFKLKSVAEVDEDVREEAEALVEGSMFYYSFSGKEPMDVLSRAKKALENLLEDNVTIAEVLEQIPDTEYQVAVSTQPNKQNPERPFGRLEGIVLS